MEIATKIYKICTILSHNSDSNETLRPNVRSDKTEEAHKTESRDNHAEARYLGREGKEKNKSHRHLEHEPSYKAQRLSKQEENK